MVVPDLDTATMLAKKYTRATVYREVIGDDLTPITLLKRFADEANLILLESANQDKTFSRFSYFGYRPKRVISFNCNKAVHGFENLAHEFSAQPTHMDYNFGDFNGGFVGAFAYEAVNYMGNLRQNIKEDEAEDLAVFFEIDEFFVFDTHRCKLFAACSIDLSGDVTEVYNDALERTARMGQELSKKEMSPVKSKFGGEIKQELDKKSFVSKVESIKEEIVNGEAIQVVFSNKYELAGEINPVSFYRTLRRINPSAYMFYLKFNDKVLCGSSPETHLKVIDNQATLKPIAGTYPVKQGDDREKIKRELLNDAKENAEHLMLVDLARNDLYTCCDIDSVKVTEAFQAEEYSHVMHIVSSVSGILNGNVTPLKLFYNTFPAGTLSGAPKVRAIELIDQYENSIRDFYGGCVGYFSYNGNLDTCITIRSALIEKERVILRAGAGIVYDSVPEREYEEVENKLGALFAALEGLSELEKTDVSTD